MKKRMLALLMVGVMTIGFGTTAMASNIGTTDATTTAESDVWGSVSNTPLKQMKVTVPIKIDFALMADGTNANKMVVSDLYAVQVAQDSQVGVSLDKINVAETGGWTLKTATAAAAVTNDVKTVSLKQGSTELAIGDNVITGFKVGINNDKKLDITGAGSKTTIAANVASEKAFKIVYTISQDTAATP